MAPLCAPAIAAITLLSQDRAAQLEGPHPVGHPQDEGTQMEGGRRGRWLQQGMWGAGGKPPELQLILEDPGLGEEGLAHLLVLLHRL